MQAQSARPSGRHRIRPADRRIVCPLCPRLCELADGERGACGARVHRNGELVQDRPECLDGLRVQPIEACSLLHFLPGTLVLAVGRGDTNLRSRMPMNGARGHAPSGAGLAEVETPERTARLAGELGCPSVALGGTEPGIVHAHAARIAGACRASGIRTIALTRGYMCPAPRAELFREIDAARIELFAFKERFYWKYCNGHIAPILDTLTYIARHTEAWLEIAVPLFPGENDTVGELERLCRWVSDELGPEVPLHFKTSHLIAAGSASELRRADISAARARRIARTNGVRYAYTDDLFEPHGRTTACHRCGTALIRRQWYQVSEWNLIDEDRCPHCGAGCSGVFAGRPAAWDEWPYGQVAPAAA